MTSASWSQTISLQENPEWDNDEHWSGPAPGYDMDRSAVLAHNSILFEQIKINEGDTLIINAGVTLITDEKITLKDGGTLIINGTLEGIEETKKLKIESGTLIVGTGGILGWKGDWTSTSPPTTITIDGYAVVEGEVTNSVSMDGLGGIEAHGTITNEFGGSIFGCSDTNGLCCPSGICGVQTIFWDGGGDGSSWSDPANWHPNIVPAITDRIIVNCSHTIYAINDIKIDGSLVLSPTTTLDMSNRELQIGEGDNDAVLINHGDIINSDEIKVKGNAFAGSGPFIINTGSMTSSEFHVGNNNGGGKLTNTGTGVINVTDPAGDAMHVDGTICNEGVINVTGTILLHGAVLTCGGELNALLIKLQDNPKDGGGASGGGSEIEAQSFSDGSGCSGASSRSIIYKVTGGQDNGPNGDDTYTFLELMIEFGPSDANPEPQFAIDPEFVSSCEAAYDYTPPVISDVPADTTVYLSAASCELAVIWEPPTITDESGIESVTSTHHPGDSFPAGLTTVSYEAVDSAGNTNEQSFNITVLDTIPPTLSGLPVSIDQFTDHGQCGAIVNWAAALASDNCTISSIMSSNNPGDFFPIGTTMVTYTAIDSAGNTNVQTFTISISDNTDPVISGLPEDITQHTDDGQCGASVNWALPSASDNCSISTFSTTHEPGSFFPVGITIVTYTATDSAGNSEEGTFNITIVDSEDPAIIGIPADIVLKVDVGQCGAIASWTLPSASDNCGINSLASTYEPGDFFPIGTTTITYTATDLAGNSDMQTFNITITDNIDPIIVDMPTDIIQHVDDGKCGAYVNWTVPTASDNCSISSLAGTYEPGDFFVNGTTKVTYTAKDSAGNSVSQSFNITITDNIDPVISKLPADIHQDIGIGPCGAIVNWTLPTASDNCSISSLTATNEPGDFFPNGTTTVTYTAVDAAGNSAVGTFDITITDNITPEISNMPADIQQNIDAGECGATVRWATPDASDNCSIYSFQSTYQPGDFFPIGTTTVAYTATDFAGNAVTKSFEITVADNINPEFHDIPVDITKDADTGQCGAKVSWVAPSASDNCSFKILEVTHQPGDFFPVGTTTVNYTATDSAGNSETASFDITILDNVNPVVNNIPDDITKNSDAGQCGTKVSWEAPTASDNCAIASLTSSHKPGDDFPVGTTSITYTATDAQGNSTRESFNITVRDNEAPAFTFCPSSFEIDFIDTLSRLAIVSWNEPLAMDICGKTTFSSNYSSGQAFEFGDYTVVYTASDLEGNKAFCTFDISAYHNRSPETSEFLFLSVIQGEELPVSIDASDPDGDQLSITDISFDQNHSRISETDDYNLSFNYTSMEEFYGNDTISLTITDHGVPPRSVVTKIVVEVERKMIVNVSSAVTLNDDMINDYWHLENIDLFPSNEVFIYDRWGSLIFQTSGYNNNSVKWHGQLNQESSLTLNRVENGTYFYVIDPGNGMERITGAIEVIK